MNKNLTEMVFILDRSGSMSGLESDTIGGYNGLLAEQKQKDGEATVTTVLFDGQYEVIHDNANITKVKPLTNKEYYARGMTALLDAVGKTINAVGNRHKYAIPSAVPGKTIIVIITDGEENSSREYSLSQVKAMIERQQKRYGWEFLFLGANIDAVSTAAGFGIDADHAVTYEADEEGTRRNFEAVSYAASCVRGGKPVCDDWKDEIEEYYNKREGR